MVQYERDELLSSAARGASDSWAVEDFEFDESLRWAEFAFDRTRVYAPLEHSELPHQLARVVGDDLAVDYRELRKFAEQYGRLGWRELQRAGDEQQDAWLRRTNSEKANATKSINAEPVEWIRAHAITIRWALAVGRALRVTRDRESVCKNLVLNRPDAEGRRGTIVQNFQSSGDGNSFKGIKLVGQTTIDVAGSLLAGILQDNLTGVRRRVAYFQPGEIRTSFGGDTLIESVYSVVADAISDGRLTKCKACGRVFIQTDERQLFCPPRAGIAKSSCKNRLRTRRYRRRKAKSKRSSTDGKTTRTR